MKTPFNPWPAEREREISGILWHALGPDPRVPAETPVHFDVDATLLHAMLDAGPSEHHLSEYLGAAYPAADPDGGRMAARRLLGLLRA